MLSPFLSSSLLKSFCSKSFCIEIILLTKGHQQTQSLKMFELHKKFQDQTIILLDRMYILIMTDY